MRGILATLGFRQCSIPYVREPRHTGKSKYPLKRIMALARDAIVSFSVIPLRLSLFTGCLSILLAVVLAVAGLIKHFVLGGLHAPAEAAMIALVCGFSGLILMVLGAIGEYLGCLIRETKQRPLYIVQSVKNVAVPGSDNPAPH